MKCIRACTLFQEFLTGKEIIIIINANICLTFPFMLSCYYMLLVVQVSVLFLQYTNCSSSKSFVLRMSMSMSMLFENSWYFQWQIIKMLLQFTIPVSICSCLSICITYNPSAVFNTYIFLRFAHCNNLSGIVTGWLSSFDWSWWLWKTVLLQETILGA